MSELIDLRSDTVTRPSAGMRAAMAAAEVGDDVFGDDPTVNALQEKVAAMLGKEAALFAPSGTMANQLAIGTHVGQGDEVICDRGSHVVASEGGAISALWGAQSCLIDGKGARGIFTVDELQAVLRGSGHHDDPHSPRQKLLSIEDTNNRGGGTVWPIEQLEAVAAAARKAGLAVHLDGARLWNASIESGISLSRLAGIADTISVCLSKGMGTPSGSLIVCSAARIPLLKRLRKRMGGGMRQIGILAAAGLYALEHNLQRLSEDHANAKLLAERLAHVPGLTVDPKRVETNMVFVDVDLPGGPLALIQAAEKAGVRFLSMGAKSVRLVTHLDVSRKAVEEAATRIARAASAL